MLRGSPARFGHMGLGVEGAHAGHRPLGGEVAGNEVCGPLGVGETHHPPFLHRRLVAPGGLLGLHGEGQPPHPGSELSGGEVLCLLQHGVGHTAGLCLLQVTGALTDHPGPGQIYPTLEKGLPDPGEPLEEIECQPEVAVGGSPGETEGRSDLLGGEPVDRWHPLRRGGIGGAVGHLGHGGVELCLVEGDLAGQHLQQRDHVVTAQRGPVDASQDHSELGTGRHLRQALRERHRSGIRAVLEPVRRFPKQCHHHLRNAVHSGEERSTYHRATTNRTPVRQDGQACDPSRSEIHLLRPDGVAGTTGRASFDPEPALV